MVAPYYCEAGVTIYHGDCREILPHMDPADAIITDPVWPNFGRTDIVGSEDPVGLFAAAAAAAAAAKLAPRLVVQLGCDSDPRFLGAVPASWPFLRACWIRYAVPFYKGRVLFGSDVAYVFGAPPESREGARVLPGEVTCHDNRVKRAGAEDHPCPRHGQGVAWLVKWFGGRSIIDPFAGSGTTLLCAKAAGVPVVGIEIEERYCEIAARRLAQGVIDFDGVRS